MALEYWMVTWWHECDYPSRGTRGKEIVAAHDADEAVQTVRGYHRSEPSGGYTAHRLQLPDLSRKRKPRIVDVGSP